MRYEVTICRTLDCKRFRRTIEASSALDAVRKANALLLKEPHDYYVVDAVRV